MVQDQATSNKNYERFLERVGENQSIWGLQHPEGGWAICASNEYESTSVYVFWSDEAYANRVAVGEWSAYQPTKIHLDSFIDNWLKGIHADGHLVGLNWDVNLCGQEKEPIEVAKALTRS